ncbi:MAG: DUF5916 domain-containing protein [bacterium]
MHKKIKSYMQTIITIILVLAGFSVLTAAMPEDLSINHRGFLVDSNNKRVIKAREVSVPPVINGVLDDAAWEKVQFQGSFLQREPVEGDPATEETRVGITYNQKNLFIGVKCYDKEPEKIIAREMRRDALVDDDDYFEMVFDTYHDQRSGFYFITNPNGVRRDAMLANEGQQYNPSWDNVWKCRTSVTDKGWFIEIAIPWKTLRFEKEETTVWGVNFARMIRRKNEHVYWQLIPRDLGHAGIFRLSEAGDLYNLRDLEMGGNLEIKPYFMGGVENDETTGFSSDHIEDIGLDAKIALTGNMTMDITINTDFAQVEADQEQVNLTRFSLYYPEKREFFREGAEIFTFGEGGGFRWGGSSSFNLFYSRRIGLVQDREARILGGAKTVGKIGAYQIGVLHMVTDDVTVDSELNPGAHFSVFRIRRDLLNRGSIGLMLLNKEEIHSEGYNRSYGIDAYLPLTSHFSIIGYVAGTSDDVYGSVTGNDPWYRHTASNLKFSYDSDLWHMSVSHNDVGADFYPEMGYIRRTDFRKTDVSLSYSPRPEKSSHIRQYSFSLNGDYRTDHDDRLLDSEAGGSFSIHFQNSARASIGIDHIQEYIPYDWEVREGYLIPEDTYQGYAASVSFQTDRGKDISGQIGLQYGTYYTGENSGFSIQANITRIPRLRMELDYRYNFVDLPDGRFHTNTYGIRTFYYFNTELYFKAYLQLNDDKLMYAGQEKVVSNLMLRWIYSPGSNIYLVYNDGRMLGPASTEIINRTLLLKVTFFWRK